MIEFPYGIADFRRIREQGLLYVDRTAHIRELERLGRILVFVRPRRFGKSLWIQTLATYYDLRFAGDFDQLFGGLAAGDAPTPLANRYFVLQWNFSRVDASGGVEQIAESLREHVTSQAKTFAALTSSSSSRSRTPPRVMDWNGSSSPASHRWRSTT